MFFRILAGAQSQARHGMHRAKTWDPRHKLEVSARLRLNNLSKPSEHFVESCAQLVPPLLLERLPSGRRQASLSLTMPGEPF